MAHKYKLLGRSAAAFSHFQQVFELLEKLNSRCIYFSFPFSFPFNKFYFLLFLIFHIFIFFLGFE